MDALMFCGEERIGNIGDEACKVLHRGNVAVVDLRDGNEPRWFLVDDVEFELTTEGPDDEVSYVSRIIIRVTAI